jgi:hypothetical protein
MAHSPLITGSPRRSPTLPTYPMGKRGNLRPYWQTSRGRQTSNPDPVTVKAGFPDATRGVSFLRGAACARQCRLRWRRFRNGWSDTPTMRCGRSRQSGASAALIGRDRKTCRRVWTFTRNTWSDERRWTRGIVGLLGRKGIWGNCDRPWG